MKTQATKTIKNSLVLLYQGEKGMNIVNSMKRHVKKILPENIEVQTAFTGKQLSTCFKTKDRTKFELQHDRIYQVKCSPEKCLDDHTGNQQDV